MIEEQFDAFYKSAHELLDHFYPERSITISSRDPCYITPAIKAKLRRRNRLRRAGRVDEANALAHRIGKDIANRNRTRLSRINPKTCSKDLWKAVKQLTGRRENTEATDSITAESLNCHYAAISTDISYQASQRKLSAHPPDTEIVSEWQLFKILDKLPSTAAGMDNLPAWFLRIGAPVFCKPLAYLFNKSLMTSSVPQQWKCATIRPVPKTSSPLNHANFKPISITPILCRTLERIVARQFLYPAIRSPPAPLSFVDQYAFRPTGSTTSALIALLQTITDLMATDSFVIVIGLDFSKAFDTVRHNALLTKMAMLHIPDIIYNWLVDFFTDRKHCTTLQGLTSQVLDISASIVQGSAVGPVSYVINASDLSTVTPGNSMHKYADDTYIVIPARNAHSREAELDHVAEWALRNNLKLNRVKSTEIIFVDHRRKSSVSSLFPPPLPDVHRKTQIKVLGVTVTNHLSVSEHVRDVICQCGQSIYALKVLRSHGLCESALRDVYRAVVIAKLLYASPAWWGYASTPDKQRIEAFIRRGVRLGLYGMGDPTAQQLAEDADDRLFKGVRDNEHHVLHHLLPDITSHRYSLRPRRHNFVLTTKTDDRNFINRQLFRDIY